MVLEEPVVFVSNTTDSKENRAVHEVVGVGTKTVDDLRTCELGCHPRVAVCGSGSFTS